MTRKKTSRANWTEVTKKITGLDPSGLTELLRDLYHLSQKNRNFIHARLSVGEDPIDSYRRIIKDYLYPDMEEEEINQISEAEEAISEYSKAAGDTRGEAELMIHFVESGHKFTLDWGDIDEYFYDSLLSMYDRAIKKVLSLPEQEQEDFRERLREICNTSSGIGWGYHDGLGDLYFAHFPE